MQDKELIEYLAKLINLPLNNVILQRVLQKTQNFNLEDFVRFCEQNINHKALDYKIPLQKFITLCDLHQKFLLKKEFLKNQNASHAIFDKFYEIKNALGNEISIGKKPELEEIFIKKSRENYFTKFEISVLERIGNLKDLISLADSRKLEESINKSITSMLLQNDSKRISHAE